MATRLALGSSSSFVQEAGLCGDLGMGPVSPEKLRQVVEEEGRRVQQGQGDEAFPLDWQAQGCPDAKGEDSLVCVGVDGVQTRQITDQEKRKRRQKAAGKRSARARAGKKLKPLPPRKKGTDAPWKEVKFVGAYQNDHQHRHWRATTGCHVAAAVLMIQVAHRVGVAAAGARIAIVDGAAWIAGRLRDVLPDLTAIILDFYHLCTHVHAAANEVFGEGSAQAQAWAKQLLDTIRSQGFVAFDAQLADTLSRYQQAGSAAAVAALTALREYVTERKEMVDYPAYEAQGWPIGSGPTESMAGVLTARVKGRGRRWDPDNLESMMALTALQASEEWDGYWQGQRRPLGKIAA